MRLIYEIKPSHYHLTHVLSRDPSPRCWIPLALTHFQSLGLSPRCQNLSPTPDPTPHWERPGESQPQSPQSGFAQTAATRCQTAQNPRAFSSWTAGHCLNPRPTCVSGAFGDCRPRCQTCSGCHLNRSPKRLVSSVVRPHLSRCCCCCCCCGGVWRKDGHWLDAGVRPRRTQQAENVLVNNKGI